MLETDLLPDWAELVIRLVILTTSDTMLQNIISVIDVHVIKTCWNLFIWSENLYDSPSQETYSEALPTQLWL